MPEYCCVEGCKSGAIAPRSAQETKNLFGKVYCAEHLDVARAEANTATATANKLIPDFGVWEAAGFRNEAGQANKIIGQVDVWVNVAGLAEGMPKAKAVQCGGYDYEFGVNTAIDAELKAVFEKLKKPETKQEPAKPAAKPPQQPKKLAAPQPETGGLANSLATIQDIALTPENIIKLVCPDATFEEAVLFLQVCKHRNLNPFIPGEIFLIKYDKTKPASTVVGKYAFTKKADAHPDYQGYIAGIIVIDAQGKMVEREGTFYLPRGQNWKDGDICETLVGGWSRIKRKGREDFIEKVPLQECIKYDREGKAVRGWRDQPATMIRKVALVRGLREAFPAELGGLYDRSEIKEIEQELE